MGFIGSSAYYALCAIALIILFIVLINFYVSSTLLKKTKTTKKQQLPQDHVPKYAAGGEMDRINRSSYITPSKKGRPILSTFFAILALVGVVFLYSKQNNTTQQPISNLPLSSVSANFINISAKNGTIERKELDAEIKSADYSQDLTKLFVTLILSNKTDIIFYSITPTINLKDENNNILQSEQTDVISQIEPGEEKEITIAIIISPENSGKIARVEYHTQYYKQNP